VRAIAAQSYVILWVPRGKLRVCFIMSELINKNNGVVVGKSTGVSRGLVWDEEIRPNPNRGMVGPVSNKNWMPPCVPKTSSRVPLGLRVVRTDNLQPSVQTLKREKIFVSCDEDYCVNYDDDEEEIIEPVRPQMFSTLVGTPSVKVDESTLNAVKDIASNIRVNPGPIKIDDAQFADLKQILEKGVDINLTTCLDKLVGSSSASVDWSNLMPSQLENIASLFSITDDLSGVVKAILIIVGISMLKGKTDGTIQKGLLTFAQIGVVYYVFKLPSLQVAFDKLVGSLADLIDTNKTKTVTQALSTSDVLTSIGACIFTYLMGKTASNSTSLDTFLIGMDNVKRKMNGAEFCLKTVSEYIVKVFEYIVGTPDSGINARILDGDPTLRMIRDEIDAAFALMSGDGVSGQAMKHMSDIHKKLKDFQTVYLRPDCKLANKHDMLKVIEALLKQVSPLASMYDASGLSNADCAFRPVAVYLYGASRIGKSRVMPEIIDAMLCHIHKDSPKDLIRVLTNKQAFVKWLKIDAKYLNLSSCPTVLAMDDYKIGRVVPGQALSETESLIFQLGSNRTVEVDGAFVKETKVNAKFVILGTNSFGPTLVNQLKASYNVIQAPLNRLKEGSYLTWVTDEFAEAEDINVPKRFRGLDKSKVSTEHDRTFKHLRFTKFDPETEETSGPDFTLEEFIQEQIRIYNAHTFEHVDLSRKYYDAMVERIKALHPDIEIPEYVAPDARGDELRAKFNLTVDAQESILTKFSEYLESAKTYVFGESNEYLEPKPDNIQAGIKYVLLSGKYYVRDSYAALEAWFSNKYITTTLHLIKEVFMDCAREFGSLIYGYRYQITAVLGLLGAWKLGLVLYDSLFPMSLAIQSGTVVTSASAKAVREKMRAIGVKVAAEAAKVAQAKYATVTQGSTMDNTTIDIMKSCLDNIAEINMVSEDVVVKMAYCVHSGRLVFMPRHYADKIAAFFETNPRGFAELRYANGRCLRLGSDDFQFDQVVCGTSNNAEDDIMSIFTKDVVKSDLSHRLMTNREFLKLSMSAFDVLYGSSYHDGKTTSFRNLLVCRAAVQHNRVCDEDEGGEFSCSNAVVTSKVVAAFGECGSLYAASSKILGFHVAGNNRESLCLHFSKEDYDAHVRAHIDLGHKIIYEKKPLMRPVDEVEIDGTKTQCAVGVLDARLVQIKPRTMKSPFHDPVMMSDMPPKYEYCPMGVSISDTQKAMLGRPLIKEVVNKSRLSLVVAARKREMAKHVSVLADECPLGLMTIKEAIDGNDRIPPMSRSTSMGIMGSMSKPWFNLPNGITKLQYFGETGKVEESKYWRDIQDRVNRILDQFRQGIIDYSNKELFVMAMPKDEHRKVGKNTRCVYAYSPILNIIVRMYYGNSVYFHRVLGFKTNIIYANPYEEGPKLYSHLTGTGQSSDVKIATDLDFAMWDILLNSTFYREGLELVHWNNGLSDEDSLVAECIRQVIVSPYVLFPKSPTEAYVVPFEAGLASGSEVTSIGNGATNDLLIAYSATCIGKSHLDEVELSDLDNINQLAVAVHGDDCVMVPSDELLRKGFSYTTIARACLELGMKPQPISKDGVIKEFKLLCDSPAVYRGGIIDPELVSNEPVEFLCRTFYLSQSGIVMANKHETNVKQLLYDSQQFRSLTDPEKIARWNQFFVEVAMRGRSYYNKFQRLMVPILLKQGLAPECAESYDVCKLHTARVVENLFWV